MDPRSSSSEGDGSSALAPLIFVVDDSNTMRRSVAMTLTAAGYRVETARDGAEALRMLRNDGLRPDLLLTDIVMPEVDGLKLIREARKMLRFTPIVALTTQGQRHLREEGKLAGATAWVIKPTGGRSLLDVVTRFVRAPKSLLVRSEGDAASQG